MRFLIFVSLLALVAWQGWERGYRINVTPSLPKGLYQLRDEPPAVGDIVALCLDGSAADLAREREYLASGSCPSGLRPLLKYLAALPGDSLVVSADSIVCGDPSGPLCLWQVRTRERDSRGRKMKAASLSGVVPGGLALVLTLHEGSYDSRYFGFVPVDSLKKVIPVITF